MACAAIIITVNNLNVVVCGADVFSLEHSFVSLQVLLGRWRSSLIKCFFFFFFFFLLVCHLNTIFSLFS